MKSTPTVGLDSLLKGITRINALNFRNKFYIPPCSQESPGLLMLLNTMLPLLGELYFCEGFHNYLLAVINSTGLILINKRSSCGLP